MLSLQVQDESRLLMARYAFGLTLSECAKMLSVSTHRLTKWEKAPEEIDQKTIEHICTKLNVSKEWLQNGNAFPFRDCRIIKMEPRRQHDRRALELIELAIEKSTRCDTVVYPGYAGSFIHFIICTLKDATVRIITLCKSDGSIIGSHDLARVIDKVVWHGEVSPLRADYNRLNETVMGKVIHSIMNNLCVGESFMDALISQKRGRGKLIDNHALTCKKSLGNIRLLVRSKLRLYK